MAVEGIALGEYGPGMFRKVPVHLNRAPARAFDLARRLGDGVVRWARERYGDDKPFDIAVVSHRIPMDIYEGLSVDELCKIHHSTMMMMDSSVDEVFKEQPRYEIYRKITSSAWRWGTGRLKWNEVVDTYEGIRAFGMGHPDFEVTLDHTTWFNECGYSKYSRTFLDGAFGYLVHYRGRHVMTIGFSVMANRRLLIQQVQLKSRRGNRWLFKLPSNYLEHVIDRFRESFPRHRLFVVDGGDVIGKSLSDYAAGLESAERRLERAGRRLASAAPGDEADYREDVARAAEEIEAQRGCIAHAEASRPRIAAFYAATGRYGRGRTVRANRLTHYELSAG